jgi:hypothetical protein
MSLQQKTGILSVAVLFFHFFASAQQAENHNSTRSNRSSRLAGGFNFQMTPQYGINLKNDTVDSLFFRGNGAGVKMNAGYSFGSFGIGLSSGFVSAETDKTKINEFISGTGVPPDQLLISTSNQQNMYFLLGPTAQFGNKIKATIQAKGGLFINNSGFVNIRRLGAVNSVYRNEPSSKSVFPGFSAGLNLEFPVSGLVSVGFATDYLNSKSEVVNYDIRRGASNEGIRLSKNLSNLMAGISIRYNILSPRDVASGQAKGQRVLPTVNKREISKDVASEKPEAMFNPKEYTITKKYQPGQPQYGNLVSDESCGQVTVKRTLDDGSVDEMTFACPEDAATFFQRSGDFSERPTWTSSNPRKTFVLPHVLEKSGSISGRVTWTSPNTGIGIITNKTIRGGGIRTNENQGTTRTTPSTSFGTMVRMSAREAGSGMATGKRQHEPVFIENQEGVCNPCLTDVKLISHELTHVVQQRKSGSMQGAQTNPLYENDTKIMATGEPGKNGIAGLKVLLVDAATGRVVATTTTESNGDFFFGNVPYGNYTVKLSGSFGGKKGYDIYLKTKSELEADLVWSGEEVQLTLFSSGNSSGESNRVNTSRSNIKNIVIVDADTDGDGAFDAYRAAGTFSDGTINDLTSDASASRVNKIESFTLKQSAMQMRGGFGSKPDGISKSVKLTGITVASGDVNGDGISSLKATASFSDGSTWDITKDILVNNSHSRYRQYGIAVADLDGDGMADAVINTSRSDIKNQRITNADNEEEPLGIVKPKTKSNQSNDRMSSGSTGNSDVCNPCTNTYRVIVADLDGDGKAEAAVNASNSNIKNLRVTMADPDGDGVYEAAINNSNSNIKNLRVTAGDVDGDGITDIVLGSKVSDFGIGMSRTLTTLQPGDPIPGVDIKLGSKKGGAEKNITADDAGKIKVIGPDMEPDTYTLFVISNIYIEDETQVTVGDANEIAIDEEGVQRSSGGIKQTMQTQVRIWEPSPSARVAINGSNSNIKNLLATVDELGQMLNNDNTASEAAINGSNSNIKNLRTAAGSLTQALDNLTTMDKTEALALLQTRMAAMNMQFLALQQSLRLAGGQYTTISNVLKTKHDTVKNSINNVR